MPLDMNTDTDWNFEILETPVLHPTKQGEVIPELKHIVNARTQQVLNTCSTSYTVLHNSRVVESLHDAVKAANISSDVDFSVTSIDNGKKLECKVIFPDVTIQPKVGDFTQYRVRAWNSYDNIWPFSEKCDGLRLFCENGMVSPRMISSLRMRHRASINVEGVTDRIVKNFSIFQNQQELWEKMMNTKVDRSLTLEFFKKHVCYNSGKSTKHPYSIKQYTALTDQLDYEFGVHGPTQWGLYNCLTFWSTHTGEYANAEITTRARERLVEPAMKSRAWDELVLV